MLNVIMRSVIILNDIAPINELFLVSICGLLKAIVNITSPFVLHQNKLECLSTKPFLMGKARYR